ncbi:methylated-DNA--[protein]-cysteine S-methyltransferase [Parafrankia discariae]|uniref:methylated-DNA--[protein]-cysteine S-methyltransferase n=1 Tax=Parafrankia discariae TaxID=365528 RepID=UPI00037E02A3|nr:methylated-DNA--[protein]-cysteine S-methyltransferase [Parafrankia discariae]
MTRSRPGPPDAAERAHVVVESPVGPLTLVASGDVLVGCYLDAQRHLPEAAWFGEPTPTPGPTTPGTVVPGTAVSGTAAGSAVPGGAVLQDAADQLAEYFAGRRTSFDLPLNPTGTDFQRKVWKALCDIPYAETISYGELAHRLGQPGASRAVGLANGRNPISIIVPCHRVIGANGSLTGYGGGLERKRHLLAFEQQAAGLSLL